LGDVNDDAVRVALDIAYRGQWGRIVATLIGFTGDWDLAEECAADAFTRALERWPRDGIPDRPGAWLTTTARHRALDRLRRAGVETTKLQEQAVTMPSDNDQPDDHDDRAVGSGIADDRLRLLFTCCHPALALDARVALTLRTLCGLTTVEIAHAFVVPEATMAKRLVRAKAKIRHAAIPYRVPPGHVLPERVSGVLAVVYLLFNEGYDATAGANLIREQLCDDAIRLATLLVELMPDEPETGGLLALLKFHHARRHARTTPTGDLVLLTDQDRDRWDHAAIVAAAAILDSALRRREPGTYQLQAAIAACHATAPTAADTDWPQIARLYHELYQRTPTPIVALNHAVAIAMADGPAAGLAHIDRHHLDDSLSSYHLLYATRADLHRRLGDWARAVADYEHAIALTTNDTERRYLTARLDETRPATS